MTQRVGTCSICGGDVIGLRGGWWSVNPPPPDECSNCGARAAWDVIPMFPRTFPYPKISNDSDSDAATCAVCGGLLSMPGGTGCGHRHYASYCL